MSSFEEVRGQVLEEMSERNERVLRRFFFRINYKGIVGYENTFKENKHVFVVYTEKPGILIGKGGESAAILKEILKNEFGYDYILEFKEIKGKMLVIV